MNRKKKLEKFQNSLFFIIISLIGAVLLFITGIIGGVNDLLGVIDRKVEDEVSIFSILEPNTYLINRTNLENYLVVTQELMIRNNTNSSIVFSDSDIIELKLIGKNPHFNTDNPLEYEILGFCTLHEIASDSISICKYSRQLNDEAIKKSLSSFCTDRETTFGGGSFFSEKDYIKANSDSKRYLIFLIKFKLGENDQSYPRVIDGEIKLTIDGFHLRGFYTYKGIPSGASGIF